MQSLARSRDDRRMKDPHMPSGPRTHSRRARRGAPVATTTSAARGRRPFPAVDDRKAALLADLVMLGLAPTVRADGLVYIKGPRAAA
jgi:hypothetical protein